MLRFFTLFLCIFIAFPALSSSQQRTLATVIRVVDGDTLKVRLGKYDERVRLIGIDTPEKKQNEKAMRDSKRTHLDLRTITALGKSASDHLGAIIKPGQVISLEFDTSRSDRHQRILAYVYTADGKMINERMLLEGYASPMTVPPNVRYAKRFANAFAQARAQRRGLWAE